MKTGNYNITLFRVAILSASFFLFNYNSFSQCDTSITDSYFYNPDFEDVSGCPAAKAELNFLNNWDQVTNGTTDFFHTCGFTGNPNNIYTEPLSPYPVGNSGQGTGAVGFVVAPTDVTIFVEYVGQCIKQPLIPNENYTLKFQAAAVEGVNAANSYNGEIVLLGRADCINDKINTEGDLEGNNGFELIGETSITMNTADQWKEITINFTPAAEYSYVALSLRPSTLKLTDTRPSIQSSFTIIDGLLLTTTCVEECVAKIDQIAGPLCVNSSTITLSATPTGGTWSGNGVTANGEFNPSEARVGTHEIIYTAKENCTDKISITVEEGDNVNIDPKGPFCVTETVVALSATPTGGIWTGNGVTNDQFNPSVAGAGTHTITYTINGTCSSSGTIEIEVADTTSPVIDEVSTLCSSSSPIQLTASVAGGTWNGNGISTTGLFDPSKAGVGIHAINYNVENGSCKGNTSIEIEVEDSPKVDVTVTKTGCLPVEATLSYTTSGVLSNCTWDLGDGTQISQCNTVNHSYDKSGCFDITFKAQSQTGCMVEIIKPKLVCLDSLPTAKFNSTPNPAKETSPFVKFTNLSQNAVSYEWDFAGLGSSTEQSPNFTFPQSPGNYLVCLVIENQAGCKDSICQNLSIEGELNFYLPNAFTPNDDNLNDTFSPVIGGIENIRDYNLQIFNRWGEKVFETSEPRDSWNGKELNNAIYVWQVNLTDNKGKKHRQTGHVALIR